MSEFKDKFIGFVDILGFKDLVSKAERGEGRPLSELRRLLADLAGEDEKRHFKTHGPRVCPGTRSLQEDLDFESTQVSDCVVASAEVSAAGAINLVHFCWGAAISLLGEGLMVRGYITRGLIYHRGNEFMGTGYQYAYQNEANVGIFKRQADERGTPFVEVDPEVTRYVLAHGDNCVNKMFDRYVKYDGDSAALFPFKSLVHSFVVAGFDRPPFDPSEERACNASLRATLKDIRARVLLHVDPVNEKAKQKADHYVAALDEQLSACDRTDETIETLVRAGFGKALE